MNKKKKSIFISIIGDEKRQSFTIPVLAILIGLIVGGIIIAITGSNPFKAYYNILQGCGLAKKPSYGGKKGMITDFMEFVNYVTPMILAALSFAVSIGTYFQSHLLLKAESIGNRLWSLVFIVAQM